MIRNLFGQTGGWPTGAAACTSRLLALVLLLWCVALPAMAGPRILVFGDSLSAAHGIPQEAGWVALLKKRLSENYPSASVVNASVSGETTAGGLARLPAALKRVKPDIVVLELGGNDGLQALPLARMQWNLGTMISDSQRAGARVLLLGMRIPPNYGPAYTRKFHAVFDTLAEQRHLAYDPFFLAPIATDRSQFQADGIHPVAAAEPALLDRIMQTLGPLIAKATTTQRASDS
ncbi:MAG: arylesterase [Salinisphaera sp.]|nr:arylesterase [Salinisphaera sp.]